MILQTQVSSDHSHLKDGYDEDGDRSDTGSLGVLHPHKRTAGDAGLNEGGKGVPGSEKVRRKGQSTDLDRSMPRLILLESPLR